MTKMTDPHNGLVSFQAALLGGHIRPRACSQHQDLSFLYDIAETSPRITYALIEDGNVVKALASFVPVDPCDDSPCFAVGYAVAKSFRGQGLAYEILEKSLDEFVGLSKGKTPRMYIEAVVGADNFASQKVAGRFINDAPDSITDQISGLPALHYMRLIELEV